MLLLPGPEHKGSNSDGAWTLGNGDKIFLEQHAEQADLSHLRQTTFTNPWWDGADVLARHLERTHRQFGKPPSRILELGAGRGLVGIAAGCLFPGASVTLTDLTLPSLVCGRISSVTAPSWDQTPTACAP